MYAKRAHLRVSNLLYIKSNHLLFPVPGGVCREKWPGIIIVCTYTITDGIPPALVTIPQLL